jgi:PPOX class probable F420-dependent enzyme
MTTGDEAQTIIGDDARKAIAAGRLAHFTTINPDGSPHTVIVWVGVDGDQVVIGKLGEDKKVRNIRRDPRVSFSIEAEGSSHGMGHYLVLEGTAEVVEGGAPELLQKLARTYVGPDAVFPPGDNHPPGFTIRITPTRIRGMGPWSS